MDWNDNVNKLTVGVGILMAIVVIYAIYRVATRDSRGSSMYRTDAQAKRSAAVRTILMLLLAVAVLGGLFWVMTAFGG